MEYTLKVPTAIDGDVIALCLVADVMARHAAAVYGTPPLYRGTFDYFLPIHAKSLLNEARAGRLLVCNQAGFQGTVDEIIDAAKKSGDLSECRYPGATETDWDMTHLLSLYVRKKRLIEWGNANGDVFHIVDAPVEVVEFGPKNEHGEFAFCGLAVGMSETPGESGDAGGKVEAVKRGITKQRVINAFEGLRFDRNGWNNALSDVPNWIKPCRVTPGVRGKKTSATWNPVLIAAALIDKGISVKKLDAVFVRLKDWADEWREVSASFRD